MDDEQAGDHLRQFTAMIRDLIGPKLSDATTFWTMLGEHVIWELPYANPPKRLEGREAVRAHVEQQTSRAFSIDRAETINSYSCEGGTTVVEFILAGKWLSTGGGFEQRCVGFITVSDGFIESYREYFNPSLAKPNAN